MNAEQAYAEGSAAWPGRELDRGAFARRVDGIEAGDPAELYIAIAIEAGVAGAREVFEARYFAEIAAVLVGRGATRADLDDVTANVRDQLFARRDDGTSLVVDGARWRRLASVLRVAALRAFLTRRRPALADGSSAWLATLVAPGLPADDRDEIERELAGATSRLRARERALLRMHLLDGLGLEAIAKMFGVDRPAAARVVASLRQELVEAVRTVLHRRGRDAATLAAASTHVDRGLGRMLAETLSVAP